MYIYIYMTDVYILREEVYRALWKPFWFCFHISASHITRARAIQTPRARFKSRARATHTAWAAKVARAGIYGAVIPYIYICALCGANAAHASYSTVVKGFHAPSQAWTRVGRTRNQDADDDKAWWSLWNAVACHLFRVRIFNGKCIAIYIMCDSDT